MKPIITALARKSPCRTVLFQWFSVVTGTALFLHNTKLSCFRLSLNHQVVIFFHFKCLSLSCQSSSNHNFLPEWSSIFYISSDSSSPWNTHGFVQANLSSFETVAITITRSLLGWRVYNPLPSMNETGLNWTVFGSDPSRTFRHCPRECWDSRVNTLNGESGIYVQTLSSLRILFRLSKHTFRLACNSCLCLYLPCRSAFRKFEATCLL
jgi:hypothetical protein